MTYPTVPPAESPRELLTALRDMTRQVRLAQRGTWFALLVLAVVNVVAIPVYRFAPRRVGPCLPGPNDTFVCRATVPGVLVYWPIALVVAYAAIATFYVRQSSRRGVGTRVVPYVVVGIALAVLLAAASLWRAVHPRLPSRGITGQFLTPGLTVADLATPAVAIALALLVLAWVEHSWALAAYSLGYLVIVLTNAARVIHSHSVWWFLPQLLIPAALLLLGSAGFARYRPSAEPR